jgi:hypothetical protein
MVLAALAQRRRGTGGKEKRTPGGGERSEPSGVLGEAQESLSGGEWWWIESSATGNGWPRRRASEARAERARSRGEGLGEAAMGEKKE